MSGGERAAAVNVSQLRVPPNYKSLISSWHRKAEVEEDYFSKFVFEYLAFIAHLKKNVFIDSSNDRSSIQRLKQYGQYQQAYIEKIRQEQMFSADWNHIIIELNRQPLSNPSLDETTEQLRYWNCSHEQPDDQTNEERARRKGVIHSLDDWENMVEFWYLIRNNLFHGSKNPENERDQFLVEHGYKTLKELVQIMIGDEGAGHGE